MIPAVLSIRYVTAPLAGARRTRPAFVGYLVTTPAGECLIKAPSWATYRATTAGLRQPLASNPCTLKHHPSKENEMATGLSKQPTRDKVYARYRKSPDLELHIKVTWIDGLEFVNLRNYVPSTKEYGKGVLFPSNMLEWIVEELGELQRQIGHSGGRPGAGQESLAV